MEVVCVECGDCKCVYMLNTMIVNIFVEYNDCDVIFVYNFYEIVDICITLAVLY